VSSKYETVTQHLVSLGEGQSIRVAIPEGWTPERWAQGLRGRLSGDKRLLYNRWRCRIKDSFLLVTKAGSFGWGGERISYVKPIVKVCSVCGQEKCKKVKKRCKACGIRFHRKKYSAVTCSPKCGHVWRGMQAKAQQPLPEEMPFCACGCGNRVRSLRKKGEPVRFCKGHRMAKMGRCLACGRDFKLKQRKFCCSRACANSIGYGYRAVGKKPWEVRPNQWHRLRCKICHKFVWRRNASKAEVCYSLSCRQKLMALKHKISKVPHDRAVLEPLVAQGLLCGEINRIFGAAVNGVSAKVAILAVGLVPNRESKERRTERLNRARMIRWKKNVA
jgi:hypothetical protein